MTYRSFEEKIQYCFQNKKLLSMAFIHSSFANESGGNVISSNERLEFLGDAVLELTISDYLYRHFPDMTEGQLTKLRAGLVCEPSLAKLARKIGVSQFLMLGRGEEANGGKERDSILADNLEAVIGAVYLDGGMSSAKKLVHTLFRDEIALMKDSYPFNDHKTFLQETIQKYSKNPICYSIIDEEGPPHNKIFTANVVHDNRILGVGVGRTKKEAEQNAAMAAIDKIKRP